MEHKLDIGRWKRAGLYQLFKDFEQPFFNVCFEVDVTELRRLVKDKGVSFFLASLYLSIRTCNTIEEFRYRLRDDGVIVHDRIDPGSTILNQDETFGFCYFENHDSYAEFEAAGKATLARYREGGEKLDPRSGKDDLVYYSILPWLPFTSFAHARRRDGLDSIPRLVFGKYQQQGGAVRMPVSLEVHHALMDGVHAGKFYDGFQARLRDCGRQLGL